MEGEKNNQDETAENIKEQGRYVSKGGKMVIECDHESEDTTGQNPVRPSAGREHTLKPGDEDETGENNQS